MKKKINLKRKETRLIARVNNAQLEIIFKKAFVYCGGNMSEYLREAAMNYKRNRK